MKGQSDSGFADVEKASEWCYLEWLYHVIQMSQLSNVSVTDPCLLWGCVAMAVSAALLWGLRSLLIDRI